MATAMEKEFDVIVFGATGFTGKYVVEELAKASENHQLKWAVAGRNKNKLKYALLEVQDWLGNDFSGDVFSDVKVIEADINDEESLSRMCSQARLILNCVGPYIFYGEPMIRACIENGAHHVDLSGEFKYLEESQAKYFEAARNKKVYIVQACGFDSIPADVGTSLIKKEFDGQLDSVEIFVQFIDSPEGKVLNSGTWVSGVNSIADMFSAKKIRQDLKTKLFVKDMPDYEVGINYRSIITYSNYVKKWCYPLPTPDVPIIQRTQMFNYQFLDETPIREAKVFFTVSSFFTALCLFLGAAIVGGMSFFSFGRYLLFKFPRLFSVGYFSDEGPTRSQVQKGAVVVKLRGKGKCVTPEAESLTEQQEDVPLLTGKAKSVGLKIVGPEPAYALTSRCMVHAAITILEEADRMPLEGGVLTPGAAFANTSLVDRLKRRDIQFEWMK